MLKNPFEEFQADPPAGLAPPTERAHRWILGLTTTVRNPFAEFSDKEETTERAIPMDAILSAHASAMDRLTDAYGQLVTVCLGDGIWQANRETIVRTYEEAYRIVCAIEWTMADVEAFCAHALQSDDQAFLVREPLGLFLSAFFNASADGDMTLDLSGQDLRLPMMGYRLRAGLTLTVMGNLGDLAGLSLDGGHLKIVGSVRSHLGAGMMAGRIDVSEDTGRFVGEQMTQGEIHVEGRLGGLGSPQKGRVFHRKQQIFGQA